MTTRVALVGMGRWGRLLLAPLSERFDVVVAHREDVERVFTEINQRMPLVRGILHAAGVGHEATLLERLHERSFWPVMAPKMLGALHLHAAAQGTPVPTATVRPFSSSRAAQQIISSIAL